MNIFEVLSIIGAGSWLYPVGVLFYKFFVKSKIKIDLSDTVRIGYTNFGPIIILQAAVSAKKKDAHIEKIEVTVTHEKGETHNLPWKLLDEVQSTITSSSGEGSVLTKDDAAIALKISTSFLSQKRIIFLDNEFLKSSSTISRNLIKSRKLLEKNNPNNWKQEIIKSKEYNAIVNLITNYMYWKKGSYEIEIKSYVAGQKRAYVEKYSFSIEQYEIEDLMENIKIIKEIIKSSLTSDRDKKSEGSKSIDDYYWVDTEITRKT